MTPAANTIDAEFPEALAFLFDRCRYKGAYSGRGAAKSWSVADALLMLGKDPTINDWRCDPQALRIVCARETQKSIADSVHALLEDRIRALSLKKYYDVQKATILGKPYEDGSRTEFVFHGLKHDPNAIKSLEGADILWVEEAQAVSKASWDIVVPTVRKEGRDRLGEWSSEIWATWNPLLDTDETHRRFVLSPPTNSRVVRLSWRDNPWFPKVLDIERLDMLRLDPAGYRNIWEGETRSAVSGAVFGGELEEATTHGRVGNFPRDRSKPVHTAWDLGYGDKTAIWFFQAVDGWFRLVDYIEDEGKTIDWYIIQLQQRGYLYGVDWLPHDCVDTLIHRNLAGGDRSSSIEMIMRGAGRNVRVAPKLPISDRINKGRMIFSQCQFHREACQVGLNALGRYQWGEKNDRNVTGREPLHNDASHGADAYQTFAVCAKQPVNEPPATPSAPIIYAQYG